MRGGALPWLLSGRESTAAAIYSELQEKIENCECSVHRNPLYHTTCTRLTIAACLSLATPSSCCSYMRQQEKQLSYYLRLLDV